MPIYAYKCDACGFAKDLLQKMSDAPLTTCASCGAEAMRKQVTAAGFQLKGSGWYVTDFRGGATGAPADAKGGEAAAEAPKSEAPASGAAAAAPSGAAAAPATGTPAPASAPSPAPTAAPSPSAPGATSPPSAPKP